MKDLATLDYKERVGYFPYAGATEKQECREFKMACLEPFADRLKNFLTLSADEFAFEQMLALNSRFSKLAVIDSFERREDVYLQGLPKYKRLKKEHQLIHYKKGDIFDAEFKKYDVVDLDLCGSFTIDLMNEMLSAFQNFNKGFIFITMTKNVRRSLLVDNIKEYGAKNLQEFRDKKFAKYLKNICGLEQYVKPYTYANKSLNSKAKEMIVYIFTKNL
jgi:hypothetical protein